MIYRCEVDKGNGHFIFTGELTDINENEVLISTIKGEKLIFRKDQIKQKQLVDMIRVENDGQKNQ